MNDDAWRSLGNLLAARADRPFGEVQWVSDRTLQPFSISGWMGAENLLTKARRAIDAGDLDRARKLVDRAARLPYDDHEQAAPAALAAHMELFNVVTDALEEAYADDSRWLDAALAVLTTADEPARYDMRDVLAAIDQDYALNPPESSRLRSAIAPIPHRAALKDLDLTETALGDEVISILIACEAYRAALGGAAVDREGQEAHSR